jgi:hypothetical protein
MSGEMYLDGDLYSIVEVVNSRSRETPVVVGSGMSLTKCLAYA